MDVVWILIGVVLLYAGGEMLVGGAKKLAVRFGVQPMVIGLTVVALGTSMPELAATLTAALQDAPEVAFGNVVGSNIANLGLVLGLGAMLYTLHVKSRFFWREVPFMLVSSVLMMWFAWDGALDRLEASVLLVLLAVFLAVQFRTEKESPETRRQFESEFSVGAMGRTWWLAALIVIGIAALTLGAKALIAGAVGLARAVGIEERVIGLTLVAFGTSLPELAGTLVAAAKREGDIILGNLIGSNVFNILFILGVSVLVQPIRIAASTAELDLAVMLVLSLLVWLLMVSGRRLGGWDGLILVFLYAVYVGWLFLEV